MHTNYFIDLIMESIFCSNTNNGIPEKYYIGLSTTTPSVNGTGVTEPSEDGTGYARTMIESFSEPTNGIVTNRSAISFEESSEYWGVITHYVVYDSPLVGNGNLLFFGELESPKTIDANTMALLRPGEIRLSLSNKM